VIKIDDDRLLEQRTAFPRKRASSMERSSSYGNPPANDVRKSQNPHSKIASLALPPEDVNAGVPVHCRLSSLLHLILILVLTNLISVPGVGGQTPHTSQPIGITQKLGQTIPAQLIFADEQGGSVMLGDLIRKPAILTLVYYNCSRFCPQMLEGLAAVVSQLALSPDKDYQIVTVSFDQSDTPAIARDSKRNYVKAIQGPFPEDAWRFLTGDDKNIRQLCDATGFGFRREMHGFAHPVALIILSPSRKITRYIHISKFSYGVAYPITFSAIELSQALVDAALEKVGSATKKEFLYCFPHEPQGQQRFFSILTTVGAITVVCLAAFFAYLSLTGRKLWGRKKL
jgi:protein SCO1/2